MRRHCFLVASIPWALMACGDSLEPTTPSTSNPPGSLIETDEIDSGVFESRLDATESGAWVYMNLRDGGQQVEVSNPLSELGWDIGLRRSNIRLNGGASGSGQGAISPMAEPFDSVSQAPELGWYTDEASSSDQPDGSPVVSDGVDFAFTRATDGAENGWFIYNAQFHTLSPSPLVWALRSADGASYFLIEILDYYDEAGTSAVWRMRWKALIPPASEPQPGFTVDASSNDTTTYVSFSPSLRIETGAAGSNWDLAFRRTQIQTNSGTSGGGMGGAREAPSGTTWLDLVASPTQGFQKDQSLPVPGPSGGVAPANPVLSAWYDYDPATRTVSPRDVPFLVRGAEGNYRKLRILSYEDGVYQLESLPVSVSAEVFEIGVDASDPMRPTYVSLSLGSEVEDSEEGWDLAITRTVFQTNSGVSGEGLGGAVLLPEQTMIESVVAAPDGYEADTMVDSGRPGIPPAPANPVLAQWFDYEPATMAVSPKDAVFGVRTGQGEHALLRILSWDDGQYVLQVRYAGPGSDVFP